MNVAFPVLRRNIWTSGVIIRGFPTVGEPRIQRHIVYTTVIIHDRRCNRVRSPMSIASRISAVQTIVEFRIFQIFRLHLTRTGVIRYSHFMWRVCAANVTIGQRSVWKITLVPEIRVSVVLTRHSWRGNETIRMPARLNWCLSNRKTKNIIWHYYLTFSDFNVKKLTQAQDNWGTQKFLNILEIRQQNHWYFISYFKLKLMQITKFITDL